jgi:hypothetical protein
MKPLLLAALLLLSGCTTAYRYVAVPPGLIPPRAELPAISSDQLQCLTDETYTALVTRERLLLDELDDYRALIWNKHGR